MLFVYFRLILPPLGTGQGDTLPMLAGERKLTSNADCNRRQPETAKMSPSERPDKE